MLVVLLFASSRATAQSGIPQWHLDASPSLSIGGEGGPGEFLRITGAFRLSSGHVAVVNAGTSEVRVFDVRGRYITTFGRQGSGPGEFRSPWSVWRAGDTIVIHDGPQLRLTTVVLGSDTKLLGTTQLTAPGASEMSIRGRASDGRWLAISTPGFQWEGPKGIRRLTSSVGLVRADGGGAVSRISELPSLAYFVYNPSGDVKKGGMIGLITFSPFVYATVSGPSLWFGDSASDSVLVVSGSRQQMVRLPIPRRVPTRAVIESTRAEAAERIRDANARARLDAALSPEYLPKTLPYYEALIPGQGGEVWVQEYARLSSAPTRYLVIGPDLKPKAWVPVPAGFRILDVGKGYVLGVHHDQDGIETVRSYSLKR